MRPDRLNDSIPTSSPPPKKKEEKMGYSNL
jgi:hypothetical protein